MSLNDEYHDTDFTDRPSDCQDCRYLSRCRQEPAIRERERVEEMKANKESQ